MSWIRIRRCNRVLNPEFVEATPLEDQRFDAPRRRLMRLISDHVQFTGSEWGRKVLSEFEMNLPHCVYVVPKGLQDS